MRSNLLNPPRLLHAAYNPATEKWHMKMKGIEWVVDEGSVKNWYAIESNFIGVYRPEWVELENNTLGMIKIMAIEKYEEWLHIKKEMPFYNLEFNLKFINL